MLASLPCASKKYGPFVMGWIVVKKKAQWNSSMMMVLHTHTQKDNDEPREVFLLFGLFSGQTAAISSWPALQSGVFHRFCQAENLTESRSSLCSVQQLLHSFIFQKTNHFYHEVRSWPNSSGDDEVDQVKLFYPTIWMMMTCQLLHNNHAPWKIGISSLTLFSMPLIFVVATSGVTPPLLRFFFKLENQAIQNKNLEKHNGTHFGLCTSVSSSFSDPNLGWH